MESEIEDNDIINEWLRSLGFIFPATYSDLEMFDKFYENYEYELTGNEIDPLEIFNNSFTEVDLKLPKLNEKRVFSANPRPFDYYKRMLLAAEIVFQLHKEPTLGHLKLQKLIYLCQQTSRMNLPTNFLKQAMGPYDPQLMRSIDIQLEKKHWFIFKESEYLKYQPMKNIGSHKNDFEKYFSHEIDNINYLIDTFRDCKSSFIELVATLYACRLDVIKKHEIFSINLIINKFYKWSEEKSKFNKNEILDALDWMEENGIMPTKI